jgi:hypothetical protein
MNFDKTSDDQTTIDFEQRPIKVFVANSESAILAVVFSQNSLEASASISIFCFY